MNKRKLIYISHPLRGDAPNNRQKAREITAELSCACSSNLFIFVNPLDMFMGQSLRISNDRLILSQAAEIMKRCDGVIFCEGWRKSRGCRIEHFAARKAGLPRWLGHETFIEAVKYGD